MKKKIFVILCLLIFPMLVLFAGCSTDSKIEIRINDGYVQWSYAHQDEWTNIISIEEIKDNLGEAYKGNAGKDGREIELRDFNGVIQWKYVDESDWKNLSKKNTFTVNFDSQGGTNIETISNIIENTKIKKPTDPTRDGYIFDGWYYQNEKWSFVGFPVTENMTLTAHWNPIFNLENGKILSLTPYASTLKTLNIPSKIDNVEITEIGSAAFKDNLMLEKVTISNSVTILGSGVFSGCKNITLFEGANNVEKYGFGAFDRTKWLEQQKRGDKLITLGSICFGLGKNYKSSELIIDDGIKIIDDWGFYSCSSIIIPNSVILIGLDAFKTCNNHTIYFEARSKLPGYLFLEESNSGVQVYWYSETKPTTSGNYWHYENDEIKIWEKIDLDLGIIYVDTNCQYNVNENITGFLPADAININYKIKDNDFIGKYLRFKIIATPDIVENISINENFVKYDDFYYYINRGYFEGHLDRPILQDTCNIDIDLRIYCLIKNNIENDVKSFNFSIIIETIQSANLSDPLNYWRTIPQQYNEKIPDTTIDPSIIYNEVDFINFVAKVNNGTASDYYVIAKDLSFTGEIPAITGAFDGILDGNGHTLYNVNISNHNGSEFYGIFAKTTKNALIQNLKIENLTIDANNVSTGLIVGVNYGTIKNCEIEGITINNSTGSDFIGKNCGSKINCILK